MLVSIIIPTKNSAKFLDSCIKSIKNQTYSNYEIIVVDNNSTDNTKTIAERYTNKIYNIGPERSAQVNYGVTQAKGEYIYKVDSDFILDPQVLEQCVQKAHEGFDAIVVHNSPDTTISWIAKIRKFEVDMYKYDMNLSSARFIRKDIYNTIGGFDPSVTAGEDFDFQNKLIRGGYKIGFIEAEALHLGEPTSIIKHLKKYYDYGRDFVNYQLANKQEANTQLGFIRPAYLRHYKNFLKRPHMGVVFIIYNFFKYFAGGLGFFRAKPSLTIMLVLKHIKSLFIRSK